MRVLLDASLHAETLAQVRRIIKADPATIQTKTLTGFNSGRYRFLEAEVTLRVDDLKKAHAVSQRIEQAIRSGVLNIDPFRAIRTYSHVLRLPAGQSIGEVERPFR